MYDAIVHEIYEVVKSETKGFDAIYEDYILRLVGTYGLNVLKMYRLVETCGIINGHQLYVLVEKGS